MLAENHRSWIHPCSSCLDRTILCRSKVKGQHLQSVSSIQHSQREVIRSNQRPRASLGSNCRVQFALSGAVWLSHQAIIKTRPRVRQGVEGWNKAIRCHLRCCILQKPGRPFQRHTPTTVDTHKHTHKHTQAEVSEKRPAHELVFRSELWFERWRWKSVDAKLCCHEPKVTLDHKQACDL